MVISPIKSEICFSCNGQAMDGLTCSKGKVTSQICVIKVPCSNSFYCPSKENCMILVVLLKACGAMIPAISHALQHPPQLHHHPQHQRPQQHLTGNHLSIHPNQIANNSNNNTKEVTTSHEAEHPIKRHYQSQSQQQHYTDYHLSCGSASSTTTSQATAPTTKSER
jgi:hypothetical protein